MQIFEYVAVLTSIIIGLGMTHLLRGVARLIQHPEQMRIYWVHLVWVAFMFFSTIFWWWWEFRLSDIQTWTFQLYLFVVIYAFVFYLACALLFPERMEGYEGFHDYFYARRNWFFGVLAFSIIVDFADSWLKGPDHVANLGLEYLVANTTKLLLFVTAAATRNEVFHAIFAVAALAYQIWFAFRLYETIA